MGGLRHRVARSLRKNSWLQANRVWNYSPLVESIQEAGLEEMEVYIRRRKNFVVRYIATRPIMDLFLEAERNPGSRVEKSLWGHPGMWLTGSPGEKKTEGMEES